MLGAQRRSQILELLRRQGSATVAELARRFGVTEMTVHRDLKRLHQEGALVKTFGGALARAEVTPEKGGCPLCGKEVSAHNAYQVLLSDGTQEVACCPHCGLLRQHALGRRVLAALVKDFITGVTLSAGEAWYVFGGNAVSCCSPPVTAFHSRQLAEGFAAGLGGEVLDHGTATRRLLGPAAKGVDGGQGGRVRSAALPGSLLLLALGLGAAQAWPQLPRLFAAPPQGGPLLEGLATAAVWGGGVTTLLGMPWSVLGVGLVLALLVLARLPGLADTYRRRRLGAALAAYFLLGVAGPWLWGGGWPLQGAPGAAGSVWSLSLGASLAALALFAWLFGRRSVCGVLCTSALFYGAVGERFIPYNLAGRPALIGRWIGGGVDAAVVVAAVLSVLSALHWGAWSFLGQDPAVLAYGLVWMLLMYLSWLAMPWLGTRACSRFLCPVGMLLGGISRWGFFRLEALRPQICRECRTRVCSAVCEASCRPAAALAATGRVQDGGCTGCGNCLAACPAGNLISRDVRDLGRRRGGGGGGLAPAGGCCKPASQSASETLAL